MYIYILKHDILASLNLRTVTKTGNLQMTKVKVDLTFFMFFQDCTPIPFCHNHFISRSGFRHDTFYKDVHLLDVFNYNCYCLAISSISMSIGIIPYCLWRHYIPIDCLVQFNQGKLLSKKISILFNILKYGIKYLHKQWVAVNIIYINGA